MMKKTYMTPASTQIDVKMEAQILSGSIEVSETTKAGSESWTQKSDPIWD